MSCASSVCPAPASRRRAYLAAADSMILNGETPVALAPSACRVAKVISASAAARPPAPWAVCPGSEPDRRRTRWTASAICPSPMNHSPRSSGHRGSSSAPERRVDPLPARHVAEEQHVWVCRPAGNGTAFVVEGRDVTPFGITVMDRTAVSPDRGHPRREALTRRDHVRCVTDRLQRHRGDPRTRAESRCSTRTGPRGCPGRRALSQSTPPPAPTDQRDERAPARQQHTLRSRQPRSTHHVDDASDLADDPRQPARTFAVVGEDPGTESLIIESRKGASQMRARGSRVGRAFDPHQGERHSRPLVGCRFRSMKFP